MTPELQAVPLLAALNRHGIRFVVIGGIAAIAQGYPLPTQDLDVTPERSAENLGRIAAALDELGARLRVSRGADVDFPIDAEFLGEAAVWTLSTRYGSLDLVFEPAGTTGYQDLTRAAVGVDLGDGVLVRAAHLRDLIRMKEASGREKDVAQLPALRRTLELVRARERGR